MIPYAHLTGTLAPMWHDLAQAPTVERPYCVVCGRNWPLNNHHMVPRSAGEAYLFDRKLPKPTITLCGSGNTGGCHGKAHSGRLHFRWTKNYRLECLELDEPTDRLTALGMDGWRVIYE